MRVEWHGQSAFTLASEEATVFIDPFGDMGSLAERGMKFDYPPIEADGVDLLLVTHEHRDHNAVEVIGGKPAVLRSTAGKLDSPVGEVLAVASEHDHPLGRADALPHASGQLPRYRGEVHRRDAADGAARDTGVRHRRAAGRRWPDRRGSRRALIHTNIPNQTGLHRYRAPAGSDPRATKQRKGSDLSSDEINEMGPIDYLIVEWPGRQPTGEALPHLVDLVDRGLIRILDLSFIAKAEDGSVAAMEIADLGDEVDVFATFEGASSGLLGDDDIAEAGNALEPGTSAALLVFENSWAAPFAAAVRRSGGQLVASGRIPVQDVLAALDAVEASE